MLRFLTAKMVLSRHTIRSLITVVTVTTKWHKRAETKSNEHVVKNKPCNKWSGARTSIWMAAGSNLVPRPSNDPSFSYLTCLSFNRKACSSIPGYPRDVFRSPSLEQIGLPPIQPTSIWEVAGSKLDCCSGHPDRTLDFLPRMLQANTETVPW